MEWILSNSKKNDMKCSSKNISLFDILGEAEQIRDNCCKEESSGRISVFSSDSNSLIDKSEFIGEIYEWMIMTN